MAEVAGNLFEKTLDELRPQLEELRAERERARDMAEAKAIRDAIAAEREACAVMVEAFGGPGHPWVSEVATAIRARGKS